jgi:acyl-CoA thioesterase FadM
MHEKRIDLRWRDLDAYGHVNQAVYLTFAEEVLDHCFQQKLGLRPGTVWDYVAARTTIVTARAASPRRGGSDPRPPRASTRA